VEVATAAGEDLAVAGVMPLSIDGLVVVASLAMLEDKRNGRIPRWSARVALVFGILATLGFNLASAEPTWTARAVAAVPAISFLLAVEVLSRTGRRVSATVDSGGQAAEPAPAPVVLERRVKPVPGTVGSTSDVATGVAEPVGPALVKPLVAVVPQPADAVPQDAGNLPAVWVTGGSNADRVRLAAARLPVTASLVEIAAAAGCSERTAGRYLPDDHPAKPGKTRAPEPTGPDREAVAAST
jgi:hypothetical protein